VALAIVVWFIAGMSLLVAGIVSHARVDTRMAQLHAASAKAAAAGDGAIQLMMASLVTGKLEPDGNLPRARFRQGESSVEVTLVPSNGLLDINTASLDYLAILFSKVGGLDAETANGVADNVVKWRGGSGSAARASTRSARRFTVMEDLLRVDGVNRALLDAIRDYIAVGDRRQRGTNWSASPDSLLGILRDADPGKAASLARQRGNAAAEGKGLPARVGRGGMYRADATVRYGDDLWLRRRWIKMEAQSGSGLPWRVFRTEAPRMIGKAI
jgi:DNA uptake protein ComE-like DNA-binding protein